MFKNRFILGLGVMSLLLVTMAVSKPFSNASPTVLAGANDFYQRHTDWTSMNNQAVAAPVAAPANDFYQRHPDWTWASNIQAAVIPVTGGMDLSDYFLRHPELIPSTGVTIDTSDYFLRHPELNVSTDASIDTSDYFLRHPELIAK
jgi:hypothetical protein